MDSVSLDELIAKGRLTRARAAYRLGSCARAAGVENRGRLDPGELNCRARRAFTGLSRRPSVALVEAAGAVSKRRRSSTGCQPWRRRNPPPSSSLPAAGQQGRSGLGPLARFRRGGPCGHGRPTPAHRRPALGGWRFIERRLAERTRRTMPWRGRAGRQRPCEHIPPIRHRGVGCIVGCQTRTSQSIEQSGKHNSCDKARNAKRVGIA